jgi:hypothetical protein
MNFYFNGTTARACPSIVDVLTHELLLFRSRPNNIAPNETIISQYVTWRGHFTSQTYETDVLANCLDLDSGNCNIESNLRPCVLAYWRPNHSDTVAIFGLDALGHLLFSQVDGLHTIVDIAKTLVATGIDDVGTFDIVGFFRDAADLGFVEWKEGDIGLLGQTSEPRPG